MLHELAGLGIGNLSKQRLTLWFGKTRLGLIWRGYVGFGWIRFGVVKLNLFRRLIFGSSKAGLGQAQCGQVGYDLEIKSPLREINFLRYGMVGWGSVRWVSVGFGVAG
jgi:hypothetical protein